MRYLGDCYTLFCFWIFILQKQDCPQDWIDCFYSCLGWGWTKMEGGKLDHFKQYEHVLKIWRKLYYQKFALRKELRL